jgi:UDP-hydrolysing UDP-N-acetyl-D-glucosamine 2-epimerase
MTATDDRDGRPRSIAVLTTGRQDWGILHSTCSAIAARPDLRLWLVVGGMHLSARHGMTVDQIRADGFEPAVELGWLNGTTDPPADVQASAALAAIGSWLRAEPPDALLLVGDRLETAAAALAATVNLVPIIHLHGGELSLGAFDDPLRHAITKLSHLHLASSAEHARRIVALGEDPATVHVVGAPGLDAVFRTDLPDRGELERDLGRSLAAPLVLVTVHPETLADRPTGAAEAVAAAMDAVPASYLITSPNADPGGDAIRRILGVSGGDVAGVDSVGGRRIVVDTLGERRYWGLLRIADAMLGNSSSGLIEAPAVDLPAVNVGDRQLGRQRQGNVIDVPSDASKVVAGLRTALDPAFRAGLAELRPALADGHAGQRIAAIIAEWRPPSPPRKRPLAVEP